MRRSSVNSSDRINCRPQSRRSIGRLLRRRPPPRILRLYDRLLEVSPSAVIELNRAVALAEVEGPAAALCVIDRLPLERSHMFHAIRADLLRRLGRNRDAAK